MPLLKPKKDEDRDDFIDRFMESDAMADEYPDRKQRVAIAYTQWRQKQAKRNLMVNSQKEEQFLSIKANFSNLVRREILEGRSYLVAPLVLMTEGCHSGSGGCLYYPASELEASTPAWNQKPVVVRHPYDDRGTPISAANIDVIENQTIGFLLDATFDYNSGLKAEAWIDIDKAEMVYEGMIEILESGKTTEVSIGVFTDDIQENNRWRDEDFDAIAFNYRPDHLAILPDQVGACSVADGAGIPRINDKEKEGTVAKPKKDTKTFVQLSLKERCELLEGAVTLIDGGVNKVVALEESAARFAVLTENGTTYMELPFTINEDGNVETGDAKEIQLSDKETPVVNEEDETPIVNEETKQVSNNKQEQQQEPVMEPKVNELIANAQYGWTEDDREFLMGLPEDRIDKFIANKVEAPKEEPKKEEAPKVEKPIANEKQIKIHADMSVEDFVLCAPEKIRQFLVNCVNAEIEKKASLVDELDKNPRCTFNRAKLEASSIDDLTDLQKMITPNNYVGQASFANPTANLSVKPLADVYAESK